MNKENTTSSSCISYNKDYTDWTGWNDQNDLAEAIHVNGSVRTIKVYKGHLSYDIHIPPPSPKYVPSPWL